MSIKCPFLSECNSQSAEDRHRFATTLNNLLFPAIRQGMLQCWPCLQCRLIRPYIFKSASSGRAEFEDNSSPVRPTLE